MKLDDRDDQPAENTEHVGQGRQDRQHEDGRQHARHDQTTDRRDGHRAKRVHLLGHDHRAELRRDSRADAAADHERRQHRAELTQERQSHDAADEHFAAEGGQRVGGLQREDHSGGERRDAGDRERLDSHFVELSQDFGGVEGPRETGVHRLPRELGQAA